MSRTINYASISQRGRRDYNQDAFLAKQLTSDIYLFAVADGMGGTFGGEKASQIAIETLEKTVLANLDKIYDFEDGVKQALEASVKAIQGALLDQINEDNDYRGMGTTLTAMILAADKFAFCNIGDSRIYQYNDGELKQLTEDHSYVQEILKKKDVPEISDEFLDKHDNIITRVLNGGEDEADHYDVQTLSTEDKKGIKFVLCSDGLILKKREEPEYIKNRLENAALNLEEVCLELSNYAYDQGSSDNITMILVSVEDEISYHADAVNQEEASE